jgi:hypothetical protein
MHSVGHEFRITLLCDTVATIFLGCPATSIVGQDALGFGVRELIVWCHVSSWLADTNVDKLRIDRCAGKSCHVSQLKVPSMARRGSLQCTMKRLLG